MDSTLNRDQFDARGKLFPDPHDNRVGSVAGRGFFLKVARIYRCDKQRKKNKAGEIRFMPIPLHPFIALA